jgi:hypothetical protein
MFSPDRRIATELRLTIARRRAAQFLPFSPAWDAAMARVEDLERDLWALMMADRRRRTEALVKA